MSKSNRNVTPYRTLNYGSTQSELRFAPGETLALDADAGKILFVSDENTERYIPIELANGVEPVVLPSGETHKRLASVEKILETALSASFSRDDRIVGIGGGVICDIAAFAASIYMRGCRLSLVPTTLLSMVDAAIGGKSGVDFGGAKNVVGSFYPADVVYIHIPLLETLSRRQYMSGLAEGIKHAFLADVDLYRMFRDKSDLVLARDTSCINQIVETSIRVKGDIVEEDLRESGIRAHLNLGHTFGHALEAATGYTSITHGEAVAWGIGKAMKLGLELGITEAEYAKHVWDLLEMYEYPLCNIEFAVDDVMGFMKADKKRAAGALRFIVQQNLGKTQIVNTEEKTVRAVLQNDLPIE